MEEAIKAISPGQKLSQLERFHSMLITLSSIDGVLVDTDEKNNFTVDLLLNAFKSIIQCFNHFGDNKIFENYLKSVDQAISFTEEYRTKDKHIIKRTYCLIHGEFVKYRNHYKKKITKSCEKSFQEAVYPIFRLSKIYLKKNS